VRFERFLPMLKLKQQQLQITISRVVGKLRDACAAVAEKRRQFEPYSAALADVAGLNVRRLAAPEKVLTGTNNIAGVNVPVFEGVVFPPADYSLFATPPWVDRALADMRELSRRDAELDVLQRQHDLLWGELRRIIQRVNLFEKIKIPENREAIRIIRIKLGDEMTAAVGRAKLAKAKLAEAGTAALGLVETSAATGQET